jgi:hypothetical protein
MLVDEEFDSFIAPPPSWNRELVDFRGVKVASYWPRKIENAQGVTRYWIKDWVERIPYGTERGDWSAETRLCHDCRVIKGEYHVPNCDVEECPKCGEQAITCPCEIWLEEIV